MLCDRPKVYCRVVVPFAVTAVVQGALESALGAEIWCAAVGPLIDVLRETVPLQMATSSSVDESCFGVQQFLDLSAGRSKDGRPGRPDGLVPLS